MVFLRHAQGDAGEGGFSGPAVHCPPPNRYDRQKLTLKDVHNCQYVACMNPTSGSFTIDPRLQVGRGPAPSALAPDWGVSAGLPCSADLTSLEYQELRGAERTRGQTALLMTLKGCQLCQVWRCTPVISALGTRKNYEFKARWAPWPAVSEHQRLGLRL